MTIRQEIIKDIKHLTPELLSNAYNYLENLKQIGIISSSNIKWQHYIGCINNEEAKMLKDTINAEFNKIEGEW